MQRLGAVVGDRTQGMQNSGADQDARIDPKMDIGTLKLR